MKVNELASRIFGHADHEKYKKIYKKLQQLPINLVGTLDLCYEHGLKRGLYFLIFKILLRNNNIQS